MGRARTKAVAWAWGLAEHTQHPAQIGERGAWNVHPRVRVLDPFHGDLLNAQASTLRDDEQLGVEEPSLVANHGHEIARDLRAHRLESALGIAKAGVQHGAQQKVVCARDSLALWAPGDACTADEPGASRDVGAAR